VPATPPQDFGKQAGTRRRPFQKRALPPTGSDLQRAEIVGYKREMTIIDRDAICRLSAGDLTSRLYHLRATERALLVEFLAYLGELDARKVYLELGFSSTFAFCTDHLGLSRSSAFRRTTAARLLARFPITAEYLADGRLGLTTLVDLRDVLGEDSARTILDRAAGRSEDEVKVLVAGLRPRPAPPDLLRRLPAPATPAAPELPLAVPEAQVSSGAAPQIRAPEAERPLDRTAKLEPISEDLRVLRMTVGKAFVEDLEAVRDALSHQIPDRRLETVIHACIRQTLNDHRRRRTGADKPRAKVGPQPAKPRGRYIAVEVRKQVWRRDEGRCAFVSSDGRRCGSTHQLEFHHVQPFAKGGPATASNLALRCKPHNGFHALKDFGAEVMASVGVS
jgi:5-methylcytosine-specific restriction endonuclease McrA